MKFLESTKSEIDNILKGDKHRIKTKTFSGRDLFKNSFEKSINHRAINESLVNIPDINISEYSDPKILLDVDKIQLKEIFGENTWSFPNLSIGSHPDFSHIELNQFCCHYCVSMFVDIKGSTRLSLKYSLMDIRQIKDTLLTAVIQVVNFFGGHVQRLQGDGIMVQFVRIGQNPLDAIINALNASSVLCYFVNNELSKAFENNGVKPLRIRVGIDYGKDQQVLWSHYGIDNCTELTTTSLHTDLAAKLQQQCPSNSILIGDNIKEALDLPDEFYSILTIQDSNATKKEIRYIFNSSYRMYEFNWFKYLLSHPYFKKDSNGKDLIVETNDRFKIKCEIVEPGSNRYQIYNPNSISIPKNYSIKYTILENSRPIVLKPYIKILWFAENRGLEAKAQNMLEHDFGKLNNNKSICDTTAAYLGHHYVKCKIENIYSTNVNLRFPIYVQ